MSLKDATLLALIGMLLLSIVMLADLMKDLLGVVHDIVPAVTLLRGFIYFLASVFVLVFLYVFRRTQYR